MKALCMAMWAIFQRLQWVVITGLCLGLIACSGTGKEKDVTVGWSAERLYSEAKEEITSGNYQQAIKLLEKLEARYPFGRYAQQAQIEAAYVYYKDNDAIQALAAADRFIKLHPNHPNVDYAYYLKGLINFNDNMGFLATLAGEDPTARDPKGARAAYDAFKLIVTRYPESKYAEDAAQRMRYLINAMASNELLVARYYFKRGAFLAAANRAQAVVRQYQQTPVIEEALAIMVRSYDAMGATDLRDDAQRVLEKNYPDTELLDKRKLAARTEKIKQSEPWWKLW
jgi:outer membrane protein assembly factor BamD